MTSYRGLDGQVVKFLGEGIIKDNPKQKQAVYQEASGLIVTCDWDYFFGTVKVDDKEVKRFEPVQSETPSDSVKPYLTDQPQYYRGMKLELIPRNDYQQKRAKWYRINGGKENVWIPNKHLSADGTLIAGENIDYVFRSIRVFEQQAQ